MFCDERGLTNRGERKPGGAGGGISSAGGTHVTRFQYWQTLAQLARSCGSR